ncbi:hypothetical protein NDU88_005510 [Pleurodeles waltl]|uniref:Uncharacterized protein n=1 Tax=Pleurodeles waltl TaxID=8319 RepID=A0AAV7QFU1_PLEWA|nr:hypothetical protein NDU88_005510 [Pleurodeles waltl]
MLRSPARSGARWGHSALHGVGGWGIGIFRLREKAGELCTDSVRFITPERAGFRNSKLPECCGPLAPFVGGEQFPGMMGWGAALSLLVSLSSSFKPRHRPLAHSANFPYIRQLRRLAPRISLLQRPCLLHLKPRRHCALPAQAEACLTGRVTNLERLSAIAFSSTPRRPLSLPEPQACYLSCQRPRLGSSK